MSAELRGGESFLIAPTELSASKSPDDTSKPFDEYAKIGPSKK